MKSGGKNGNSNIEHDRIKYANQKTMFTKIE